MAERRESVRLELLDSGFSTGMAKDAASVLLLERALKSLDGTTVNVHQRISDSATGVDSLSRSSRDADSSINQLTGRLRVLGEVAAILGPGLTPVGGVAIAGVAGLASQMGFAAIAGGVLIGSLQGVGDALGAMNKAQLEPTDKNLEKARDALRALSPAARDFAREAFALKPALVALRDLGAEAVLPGLTESLDSLEDLGPRVAGIMEAIGGELGDIASDSAASLASERWAGFFRFIEEEGPSTLGELATTVGALTHGLAELWQAFQPLNSDFSSWLMDVAAGFDDWATGLSATRGFSEFIDYVRTTGPQVADTFGAIASAVVQIVQATAPLGGPVLAGLEAVADAVGAIADSDLGTPILTGVAALSLLNRTLAATAALSKVSLNSGLFAGLGTVTTGAKQGVGSVRTLSGDLGVLSRNFLTAGTASERMAAQNKKAIDGIKGTARAVGPTVGLMGGLAVASTGAADALGLTNTTSLALMGSLGGPPGVAIGVAAGALLDLKAAGEGSTAAIQGLDAAIQSGDMGALTEQIAAAKAELADLTDLDANPGDIFDRIGFQVADTFGGPSMDDARKKIEESERALDELTKAQERQEAASRRSALAYASEVGLNVDLAKWRRRSVEDIKAQADALATVRKAAADTAQSFTGFGDDLNDASVSLDDFIRNMQESADALANFNTNSLKAARRGLDEGLISSLRDAGKEGALRMKQLANATEEEIDRANRAYRRQQRELERTADVAARLAGFSPIDLKVNADAKNAMSALYEVQKFKIADKTFQIHAVRTGGAADGGANFLSGGTGSTNALGDFKDRHDPEIASGRSMRMWAEPETQGESYIPHANDSRRPRAKRILEQTAGIFGGSVQWFADGGVVGKKRKVGAFDVGPVVIDNTAALETAIRLLTDRVANQTKATERDVATRDAWAQKMADVAQGTIAGFNTGLFERDSNPWAAGAAGGPLGNLTRDIAGLQDRAAIQSQLVGMGITGDSLAALLSEAQGPNGNAQLMALIQSGQAQSIAALYNQRAALQGSVGSAAGQGAYGAQFDVANKAAQQSLAAQQESNARLLRLEAQLASVNAALADAPERTGDELGRVINGGAAKAHRTQTASRR